MTPDESDGDDPLRQWLRRLGVEQLTPVFERHRVSIDDLNALGLDVADERETPIDARNRLLNGIAELTVGEWSRRNLTVLCCDMMGSVELSERLDPEDYGDVLALYRKCCRDVIKEHNGYIAEWSGDGMMAHFGYPHGDEHAPKRAVDAGLTLLDELAAQTWPTAEELNFRVGVTSGTVVVGPGHVAGHTPNLAFRLQAIAEPNTLVLDEDVRELLRGVYECESLGEHVLKGVSQPCRAWTVRARVEADSWYHAAHPSGTLTPMVGREAEFDLLMERWKCAKRGEGAVAVIRGEAGIGKSRLIEAVRLAVAQGSRTQLRFHCSPLRTHRQLYPVVRQVEHAAGIQASESEQIHRAKLDALLRRSAGTGGEMLPVISALLGLPLETDEPHLGFTLERRREATLKTLEDLFTGITLRGPVLMLIEDVQWCDAQSIELFARIIERIASAPVLCLVSQRLEPGADLNRATTFVNSILELSHVESITLDQLAEADARALVNEVASAALPSPELLTQILSRAGGLPLYLEEMTRYVIASASAGTGEGEAGRAAQLAVERAIPVSLQDALTARLDRLGSAKQVAQIAAALGREFLASHVVAASDLDEVEVERAVMLLQFAEVVRPVRGAQSGALEFKHALLQDAAYQSLLRRQQRKLHGRIASALEREFPGVLTGEPEILARHFEEAANPFKATEYWSLAAECARENSAMSEAMNYLEAGNRTLLQISESKERARLEVELRMTAGKLAFVSQGSGSDTVGQNFERALFLCDEIGDLVPPHRVDQLRSENLRGLWGFRFVRADFQRAKSLAEHLLEHAGRVGGTSALLEAHRAYGMTMLYMGQFERAREHLEAGFALYDSIDRATHLNNYANDPGVACLCYLAKTMWFLGFTDESRRLMRRGLDLAATVSHPFTTAQANTLAAMLATHMRDLEWLSDTVSATAEIAERHGDYPLWTSIATALGAWGELEADRGRSDVSGLRSRIVAYEETRSSIVRPMFLGLLADAHRKRGDVPGAQAALDEAIGQADRTDEGYYAAELQRIWGEIALAGGEEGAEQEAERRFRRAISLARKQRAFPWELRATVSLATLLESSGRRAEASSALEQVLALARDSGEYPDLMQAREALERLSGSSVERPSRHDSGVTPR